MPIGSSKESPVSFVGDVAFANVAAARDGVRFRLMLEAPSLRTVTATVIAATQEVYCNYARSGYYSCGDVCCDLVYGDYLFGAVKIGVGAIFCSVGVFLVGNCSWHSRILR